MSTALTNTTTKICKANNKFSNYIFPYHPPFFILFRISFFAILAFFFMEKIKSVTYTV